MTLPKDPSKIDEYLKKLSEAQKGERNHNYGKPKSKETRKKMSEAQKGEKSYHFGKPGANLGRSPSEEARHKMSLAKKGISLSPKTRIKIGKTINIWGEMVADRFRFMNSTSGNPRLTISSNGAHLYFIDGSEVSHTIF